MKYIQPDWNAPASIKAFTTVRDSWGERSEESFQAKQSEQRLTDLFQLPSEPLWVTQTHSNIALEASAENKLKTADATFTATPNRVCIILTADCLPVLICNKQATKVAAIHAGWRGLANDIIEATVKELNQASEDLLVWLGPAIGPRKFEVGKDVYDAFTSKHAESANAFIPHIENKWHANLYELARIRLQRLGITQIHGGDYCTYTQDDLFFSYRRDNGKTGRMASLIWIAN